jgi:type IV pilus assembly protein PilB
MSDTIAQVLVRAGKLTPERLTRAIQEQERSGRPLPEMLQRLGYCNEQDIQRAFAESLGLPILESSSRPDPEVLALVPAALAQKHMAVPFQRENGTLLVALADPTNLTALDDFRLATGLHVQPAFAERELLQRWMVDAYAAPEDDIQVVHEEGDNVADLQRLAREALVVRLVNNIFREAVRSRASDIHVEPFEDRCQVRYRIDGVLHEQPTPPARRACSPPSSPASRSWRTWTSRSAACRRTVASRPTSWATRSTSASRCSPPCTAKPW